MDLAIQTRDLSRSFQAFHAVKKVNLEVEKGTFYGFLGPNGAGKSTTIKMLTGLLAPSSGQLRVLGLNPLDTTEGLALKKRIGVVPEDLALFDNLTAREHLTFIGRMHTMEKSVMEGRIEELLQLMSLDDDEEKLTVEFSHGMKKKLSLAAALLPDPELLFLDEPFEGVDAIASRTIRNMLGKYVERGRTVFLTSHILEIVERLCTHVGIIVKGELVEQTSLAALGSGGSLETRFLEVTGNEVEEDRELSWFEEADA